jgi:uncharacterized membrane protein YdjX (TVP38/TMEM64 family)
MPKNLKLILALIYFLCLIAILSVIFYYLDFRNLTNYSYIQENSDFLIEYKNNNLILSIILFFLFVIIWIFFLGFASPIALISGFIFGPLIGTLVTILSLSFGSTLLYLIANIYFSEIITKFLSSKISKFKDLFNKNEFLFFFIFRLSGGAGIPYPIQNILPVIFDIKTKNYFYATLLGLLPSMYILNSLGSGINSIIKKGSNPSFMEVVSDSNIYLPIAGFFVILIISLFIRKKFFKNN